MRLKRLMRRRNFAGIGRSAAAAQLRDDRLTRTRWSGDAMKIDRGIVNETEIRAALPDGQLLGEVPIGAKRGDAEFGDRPLFAGGATSAMNMSVPI